MDELCSLTVLDYIQSLKKFKLCRIVLFAETILPGEKVFKSLTELIRENFVDQITGLMLVQSNFMIHLIEATEEEIFQVLLALTSFEPKFFHVAKYIPMEINVEERFFDKWYGRKISDDFHPRADLETIEFDPFEHVTKLYETIAKNLYSLFNELREARLTNRTLLMEKLEHLANSGDPRHPGGKILKSLLDNRWGERLEKLVDGYWHEVCPRELDEKIWPFPENGYPPMSSVIMNVEEN